MSSGAQTGIMTRTSHLLSLRSAAWVTPSRRQLTPRCARLVALACTFSSPASLITKAAFDAAKVAAVQQKYDQRLPIEAFLQLGGLLGAARAGANPPILDVRAPCEFAKGHIPGAINVPLFDDEERATVGTLYKRHGHDTAVKRGLQFVDRKGWEELLSNVPALCEGDDVLVYCFRGGMRSGGMAHLLSQAPLNVQLLDGGYKGFRQWAISQWESDRRLVVVGGPTGSGKTEVLETMRDDLSLQILDLEGDANHRGSIFGGLGRPTQPTNEMYENILALQWGRFAASEPVYIEDESHAVGRCGVPPGLWERMRDDATPVLRLDVPRAARVEKLVSEYGVYPPGELADCVRGLVKRLGHDHVNQLCEYLEETPPRLAEVAEYLLVNYYDDMYKFQATKRPFVGHTVPCDSGDALDNARRLVAALGEHYP